MGAFAPNSRGPRLLRIIATPTPGKPVDDLEAAIYAEVERVKTGPIADWEIEKARNTARRSFVASLGQLAVARDQLAENALFFNDPNLINTARSDRPSITGGRRPARRQAVPDAAQSDGRRHMPKAAAAGPDPDWEGRPVMNAAAR